jgi:hypothetical protein
MFSARILLQSTHPRGPPALARDVLELRRGREEPMQREDVAHLGPAGIVAPDPLWVGDRGAHPLPDLVRLGQDADRVAERLAHLRLAVEPHDAADVLVDQRFGLGKVSP